MDVVINPLQHTVEIADGGPTLALAPAFIRLELAASGPQGPQGVPGPVGPPGGTTIGGLPVVVSNPQPGDVLQLSESSTWTNSTQQTITDGGNF